MSQKTKKTTDKRTEAILALLESKTLSEAAQRAKISRRTLYRYLQDEAFQAEYEQAKRDIFKRAVYRLAGQADKAVQTLIDIETDKKAPTHSRVKAAQVHLGYALKTTEPDEINDLPDFVEFVLEPQSEGKPDESEHESE